MPRETASSANTFYYGIGKTPQGRPMFRQSYKEEKEGSHKRAVKIDNVEEFRYDIFTPAISGFIKSIESVEGKYGEQLEVIMDDGEGETYNLKTKLYEKNQFSENFLNRFCNSDPSTVIRLAPYRVHNDETNKDYDGMSLKQREDEETAWKDVTGTPLAFTKDTPKDMPEWSKTPGKGKDKGKTIYDNDERIDFLLAKAKELLSGVEESVGEGEVPF